MSQTRLPYDSCATAFELKQSVRPGHYMVTAPWCESCVNYEPHNRLSRTGVSVCDSLVDVDSELMGITRKQSRCPALKYIPPAGSCSLKRPKECDNVFLTTEDCRVSNPPCTMRCTGWNRWESLCRNPQERVMIPFEWNIDYRRVVKDNHRPCLNKPLDQIDALPPSMPDPDVSWSTCWDDTTMDQVNTGPTWVPKQRYY